MDPTLNGLPLELQAQQIALARRQALAQALVSRAQTPIQNPTNPGRLASVQSPLAALVPALSGFMGGKMQQEGDQQTTQLAKDYNTQMGNAVRDYITKRDGQPGAPGAPATGPTEFASPSASTPATPATAGDPREAAVGALTSGFPTLQSLGQMDLANMQKEKLLPKDLLAHADKYEPNSVVAAAVAAQQGHPSPASLLVPKKEYRAVGDNLVRTDTETPTVALDASKKFELNPDGSTKQYTINGDLYQREMDSGKMVKMDNAPKVSVTNQMPGVKGPVAGAEKLFELGAKTIDELGKTARSAQSGIEGIGRLKQLDSQGIFSNGPTGPTTFLTNWSQGLGFKISPEDQKKLANTENYNSLATKLWQDSISQFGGNRNVTAPEAEQIKQLIPLSKHSPSARAELYDILTNVAQREIGRFQKANRAYVTAVTANDPSIWQKQFEVVFNPVADGPTIIPNKQKVDSVAGKITDRQGTSKKMTTEDGYTVEEVTIPGSK